MIPISTLLPSSFEPIFITYTSLIILAMIPIYIGSKQSVSEMENKEAERLSQSDAYWFPIFGSAVLFGFYLLFRYFSKEYINYLLTAYFGLFGVFSVGKMLMQFATALLPERFYFFDYYRLLLERKRDGVVLDTKITWLHGVMGVASLALTVYYVWSKNWIASNLFGEAFAISAISMIHLDTFGTGMILLSGLFLYDIFWVFGTNVMVSVAKSFNVPVKLLFPRDIVNSPNEGFSMLGLGDIVIPGTLISMCLKFDHHLISTGKLSPGRSPYFKTAMFFYFVGLATTMAVMHIFHAAQPALLYLSPAGILSVLLTALVRGELKDVFAFTTEPVVEKDDKDSENGDESEDKSESDYDEETEVYEHSSARARPSVPTKTSARPLRPARSARS